MSGESPTGIFVYGTLQRGQVRERCWPRTPIAVEPATVRGALFDLGPYPALVEGDDTVAGELWRFALEDMPATLSALDAVEGFAGREDDLYRRVIVTCTAATGVANAWTYRLARASLLQSARRIAPGASGICAWQAGMSDA
ncbi:MAG: gamma-glutamylcyclotransferase [Planctomycetaceae bacterium]|nr:gamma-glutamylcyclotransferase [Planctomycetaceae bacterium]